MSANASILLNQVLNSVLFVWSEDYWNCTWYTEVSEDSGDEVLYHEARVIFFCVPERHFILDELSQII